MACFSSITLIGPRDPHLPPGRYELAAKRYQLFTYNPDDRRRERLIGERIVVVAEDFLEIGWLDY